MEFGAIQCAPKNPDCQDCPLNEGCIALQKNKINELPVKIKKTKIRNRYFNYLVILDPKIKPCYNSEKERVFGKIFGNFLYWKQRISSGGMNWNVDIMK